MKMCKYCGGMIGKRAFGAHGRYCKKECWDAACGFIAELNNEYRRGKMSVNSFEESGGQMSDGGAAASAMYDELDHASVRAVAGDMMAGLMRRASEIHPLLPSVLVLIAKGMTQAQAAGEVGMDTGLLSRQLKRLRKSLSYK
jgi:hypothetical protein